jgi:hypothetical protein
LQRRALARRDIKPRRIAHESRQTPATAKIPAIIE